MQAELTDLQERVRKRRHKSGLLALGAAAVVSLGLVCWGAYYAKTTLCYARLADVGLARDPADAERLTLSFRPASSGRVGFGRGDEQRQTQLLDRIRPDEVGQPQEFQWRVSGVKAGDAVQVTYLDGWRLKVLELPVPEADAPGRDGSGAGVLAGRIVNAINKEPIANATVRVVGSALTARSDPRGVYRIIGAPTGTVPVEVAAEGFATETFERDLTTGRDDTMPVALSPGLEKGQIRIVLTWGSEAHDLDAHLEGPLPGSKRFHVYYHQKGDLKSKEYVRLDADAQDGGGPETITVLGVLPGAYRYFVHDYTNRSNPEAKAISASQAEVKVFQGGQTYRFRAGGNAAGNLWDVCTIEVKPEGAVVSKVDRYEGAKLESLGLFAKRTMADRDAWIGRYGGNVTSEKAVTDGLDWLARHQGPGGLWSCDTLGRGKDSRCETAVPCRDPGGEFEMAHSGLSLLAFQAGGHYYFNKTAYSDLVKKGLDWLVENQHDDGCLVGSKQPGGRRKGNKYHQYHMYEHGIATFALADACASARAMSEPENPQYSEALKRATAFIEKGQHKDGGWRYTQNLGENSDTSVTGWQILALKSAREAGLPISEAVVQNTRRFLESRATGVNGRTGYDSRHNVPTDATTGVGMLGYQFLLDEPRAPLVQDAAKYLAEVAQVRWGDPAKGRSESDFYLWYNCTLAMFQAGGEAWKRWNEPVRNTLIDLQRHNDCERGSWDPADKWGSPGGRIYSTALAILTLETYYRYTSQGDEGDGFEMSRSTRASSQAGKSSDEGMHQQKP